MPDYFQSNLLLDLYQSLLTPRQQQICELYYREDLSLSEIAQELEISRAAVSESLHKSLKSLEKFESALHLLKKKQALETFFQNHPELQEEIRSLLDTGN